MQPAISDGAASAYNAVLSDVDEGVNYGRIDDTSLSYEDVVSNLEREEGDSFTELLKGRPDDRLARDDTVPAHPDVGEVAPDNRLALDDILAIKDDVL